MIVFRTISPLDRIPFYDFQWQLQFIRPFLFRVPGRQTGAPVCRQNNFTDAKIEQSKKLIGVWIKVLIVKW